MHSLSDCRDHLDQLLPGSVPALTMLGFQAREHQDGAALALLKELGVAKLAVSKQCRGDGLSAYDLASATVGLGSLAPSAAVAVNMHHFTVAALEALRLQGDTKVWALLEAVSTQNLYVASGFAEGSSRSSVIEPKILGKRTAAGSYLVTGSKKPCSLARSMDILSLSISLDDDPDHYGVALIPATSPGVSVHAFWNTPILAAAESHRIELDNVEVADDLIIRIPTSTTLPDITVQDIGFVWFELLMIAAYTGILGRLVELSTDRPEVDARAARIAAEHGSILHHVLAHAATIDTGIDRSSLSSVLALRCTIENFIERAVPICLDAIGGVEFITNPEVQYLASAVQCLRFHPPSMSRMSNAAFAEVAAGTLAHVH